MSIWDSVDDIEDNFDEDIILQLINTGRYKEARCCITVLCELWTKANYKYKYDEIIERLNEHRRKHPED